MYPYFRVFKLLAIAKRKPRLNVMDESVLKMRVWPGDIDVFKELNNGRHLTMMDFGRFDLASRSGLLNLVRKKGWGLAVAGASVRYRHRLHLFNKFTLHTQVAGWDDRWFYFHQQIIRNNKIHSAALIRTAVTSSNGIVSIREVIKELGLKIEQKPLAKWVKAWAEADELRPWILPK
jgi:acyl-CoA thioesterase FadM